MVSPDKGNLKSKVFFVWGSTCIICVFYAYFLIWETKGLTLEQVDRMMEECGSPRKSVGWRAHTTFASGKLRIAPIANDAHSWQISDSSEMARMRPSRSEAMAWLMRKRTLLPERSILTLTLQLPTRRLMPPGRFEGKSIFLWNTMTE